MNKKSLGEPSIEQKKVIESVGNNHNTLTDAIPGSGKTTTSLHITKNNPKKKVLILTYNKRLKNETREKKKDYEIENVEIHSYHSFNKKYYRSKDFTDTGIIKTLDKNTKNNNNISFDIIILDEAQDITFTYYKFICKIYHDFCLKKNSTICVFGDRAQCIFDFNFADNRFLTCGNDVFNFNNKKWDLHNLTMSYRLTNNTADFINKSLIKCNRINSQKKGKMVQYMVLNLYNESVQKYIYNVIYKFLLNGYNLQDIFVLAPSVKTTNSPIIKLVNFLSLRKKLPIYVSSSDNDELNDDVIKNKLVITTFHQVKGLERKIVIVTSFDNNYFKYYKKNSNPNQCPNEIFVACSRAEEHLIVIQNTNTNILPFMDFDYVKQNCHMYYNMINIMGKDTYKNVNINYNDYLPKDVNDLFDKYNKCLFIINKDFGLSAEISSIDDTIYAFIEKLNNFKKQNILLEISDTQYSNHIYNKYNAFFSFDDFDDVNSSTIEIILIINFKKFAKSERTYYIKNNKNNFISSFDVNDYYDYKTFIDINHRLYNYVESEPKSTNDINSNTNINNNAKCSQIYTVTDLCKYIPSIIIHEIISNLKFNKINKKIISKNTIKTYEKIKYNGNELIENVSNITGQVFPIIYEFVHCHGKSSILERLKGDIINVIFDIINKHNNKNKNNNINMINLVGNSKYVNFQNIYNILTNIKEKIYDKTNKEIINCIIEVLYDILFVGNNYDLCKNTFENTNNKYNQFNEIIKKFLIITNLYFCVQSGFYHPMKQIKSYDWIKFNEFKKIYSRIKSQVSNNLCFEIPIHVSNYMYNDNLFELDTVCVTGRIDLYDKFKNVIFELKCTSSFDSIHKIQLALYAYIVYINFFFDVRHMLFYYQKNKLYDVDFDSIKQINVDLIEITCNNKILSINNIVRYKYFDIINIPRFFLFNLLNNEIIELEFNFHSLKKIMSILINHKIKLTEQSFDMFKNEISKIKQLYFVI